MIVRTLPVGEWYRLAPTELGPIVPWMDETRTVVKVVEDAGQIVGTWALVWVRHAEGLSVHPALKGRQRVEVGRLLKKAALEQCRKDKVERLATAALSPAVVTILHRLKATELKGRHFVFEVSRLERT